MKNAVVPFSQADDTSATDAANTLRAAADEHIAAVALDHTPDHLLKLAIQLGQVLDAHQASLSGAQSSTREGSGNDA